MPGAAADANDNRARSAVFRVHAYRRLRTQRFAPPPSPSAEGLAAVFRLLPRAPWL